MLMPVSFWDLHLDPYRFLLTCVLNMLIWDIHTDEPNKSVLQKIFKGRSPMEEGTPVYRVAGEDTPH